MHRCDLARSFACSEIMSVCVAEKNAAAGLPESVGASRRDMIDVRVRSAVTSGLKMVQSANLWGRGGAAVAVEGPKTARGERAHSQKQ